jgi:hypothetical protein
MKTKYNKLVGRDLKRPKITKKDLKDLTFQNLFGIFGSHRGVLEKLGLLGLSQ